MIRLTPGVTARATLTALWSVGVLACGGGDAGGERVEVTVPAGATFEQVVDSLEARGVVGHPTLFSLFARLRGADRQVRAGRYAFSQAAGWAAVLEDLVGGRVLTDPLTIPEGLTLPQIADRIARVSEVPTDSVRSLLEADGAPARYGVPGPGLEGYLLPETYRFATGTPPERIVEALTGAYLAYWSDERRARLDSLGMTRAEATTLASIVQAEARYEDEMPLIAAVYHNRLRDGWPLQADPTVLYALGGTRERLLYAAMDSVADHPYNTYTRAGLPPGPIGAPGRAALDATLAPADADVMYFVAMPGGRHAFSRTLAEHNRAVAEARRARDTASAPRRP